MGDHFTGERAKDFETKYRPYFYPLILDRILDRYCLVNVAADLRVIVDVGCGYGENAALLARKCPGATIVGIDKSERAIGTAKSRYDWMPNLRFEHADIDSNGLPFKANSIDLLVSLQAAHWFDVEKFCAEVKRVLRPDAFVALASWRAVQLRPAGTKPLADDNDEPINAAKLRGWPLLADFVDDRIVNIQHTEYQIFEEHLPWKRNFMRIDYKNDISLREYRPFTVGQVRDLVQSYAIWQRFCLAHPKEAPDVLDDLVNEYLLPIGNPQELEPDTPILLLLRHFILITYKH